MNYVVLEENKYDNSYNIVPSSLKYMVLALGTMMLGKHEIF